MRIVLLPLVVNVALAVAKPVDDCTPSGSCLPCNDFEMVKHAPEFILFVGIMVNRYGSTPSQQHKGH